MHKHIRSLLVALIVILLLVICYVFWIMPRQTPSVVEEVTPPIVVSDGSMLSEKGKILFVDSPTKEQVVTSPLKITGKAAGWYFEASFPVELQDKNGNVIAQGPAQAQGDWMTAAYVPFEATLTFTKPADGETGTLILRKDNPSGLPEHDDFVKIPVKF